MKLLISIFLNLLFVFSLAQEINTQENDTIVSGVLTLINDDEVTFYDLYKKNEQYFYTNVSTGKEEHIFEQSIKQIEEKKVSKIESKTIKINNDYINQYPTGVYKTKEDFISKIPIPNLNVEILTENSSKKRNISDGILSYAFKKQGEKVLIKNVFAISYNGALYLNEEAIVKNRRRSVSKNGDGKKQEFAKVIISNENFMYAEAEISTSSTAVTIVGTLTGGLIGAFAGTILTGNNHGFSGVIWDNKKRDFLLFKNCRQYNKIIQELPHQNSLNCKSEYTVLDLRLKVNQSIN